MSLQGLAQFLEGALMHRSQHPKDPWKQRRRPSATARSLTLGSDTDYTRVGDQVVRWDTVRRWRHEAAKGKHVRDFRAIVGMPNPKGPRPQRKPSKNSRKRRRDALRARHLLEANECTQCRRQRPTEPAEDWCTRKAVEWGFCGTACWWASLSPEERMGLEGEPA